MLDPNNVPEVFENENLVRFILSKSEFSASTMEVKPTAFVPYSHTELSMNRQREATIDETWTCARTVARLREKSLYGLVNVPVSACIEVGLVVKAAPIEGNPNHVNVGPFPSSNRQDQMAIALKLRARLKDRRVHAPSDL